MIHCLNCRAETSNGLALCDLCRRYAASALEYLPIYFANLSRWSPGNAKSSRPVPSSREPARPNPGNGDRVGRALDETHNMLTTRARELAHDRTALAEEIDQSHDTDAATVTHLCAVFANNLTSLATLDWCGDLVRDLDQHETALRELGEQVVPGWYAGACTRCRTSTYVMPGVTWVTCRTCGATTHVAEHLDLVLNEARTWVARPKHLAEAIVAMVDTEPSVSKLHDRIRQWEARGHLTAVRRLDIKGRPIGAKRYRLGDILDLVHDTPTRGSVATG